MRYLTIFSIVATLGLCSLNASSDTTTENKLATQTLNQQNVLSASASDAAARVGINGKRMAALSRA